MTVPQEATDGGLYHDILTRLQVAVLSGETVEETAAAVSVRAQLIVVAAERDRIRQRLNACPSLSYQQIADLIGDDT